MSILVPKENDILLIAPNHRDLATGSSLPPDIFPLKPSPLDAARPLLLQEGSLSNLWNKLARTRRAVHALNVNQLTVIGNSNRQYRTSWRDSGKSISSSREQKDCHCS